MKLTEEQREKLLELLVQSGETQPCAICGGVDLHIVDYIFELREFAKGDLTAGGTVFPVVPLLCKNCGCTRFVSAIVAGILPRKQEVERESGEVTE